MARRARGGTRARLRAEALEAARAVRLPGCVDVAVVGGGPAGLACAIAAAEAGPSVAVLERELACGRTILPTGNGRCNLSNARLSWERYNEPAFVEAVCGPTFGDDVRRFLEGCGLALAEEEGGRLYPLSRQAASVRAVLLARARRAGVVLAPARAVEGLEARGGGWVVRARLADEKDERLAAGAVVVACGGGARLLGELELACAPFSPVLCPLACEAVAGVDLAALDGRRAHVVAQLLHDGREAARERGEVLFRPYGISGIVAFDLSRATRPDDVVALDLTCGLDAARAERLARTAGGLEGLLDPVVAEALGGSLELARDLRLVVRGPAEPERAQVTRGGLVCDQFDPTTLEARAVPGLFACGEALDVDGACGGFNLAWAWKSGLVAGAAAAAWAR